MLLEKHWQENLFKVDTEAWLTYAFGISSAVVMGVGMYLSMKVIGNGSAFMFVFGVIFRGKL